MNKNIFLSVVIPVYNESLRLHRLAEVINYFSHQKYHSEIIVVDDGSTDNSLKKISQFKAKGSTKIKQLNYVPNQGKGFAIRTGMLKACGQYRLFTDVDLSTPIETIELFLPYLKKYPVIIGTRRNKEANVVIHQSIIREFLGQGFTFMSRRLLNLQVSDFTCGFKCFSASACQKIFTNQTINRWGFDTEILFLAHKFGFPIKEIPVTWKNDTKTKVKFPQDLINSLSELISILINDKIKHIYR
jgi:dolichyl-phosphate beta-glucosyltransferase